MVELIKGDSSDIFEFSTKDVPILDDRWVGTFAVKTNLIDDIAVVSGALTKNPIIYNEDSLVGSELDIETELFQPDDKKETVTEISYITDEINKTATVTGTILLNGSVVVERWVYITIIDKFNTKNKRRSKVKSDVNGEFSLLFSTDVTIKHNANEFLIFQLTPQQSELLEPEKYNLVVEIQQLDINDNIIFRKEVMQEKLVVSQEGIF